MLHAVHSFGVATHIPSCIPKTLTQKRFLNRNDVATKVTTAAIDAVLSEEEAKSKGVRSKER